MLSEMLEAVAEFNQAKPLPEFMVCRKCDGTGFVEYEVDYFGRKTEWGRCNAPGCEGGMVEVESGEASV